jgi:membrane fusion protein (multidrug efflux system)
MPLLRKIQCAFLSLLTVSLIGCGDAAQVKQRQAQAVHVDTLELRYSTIRLSNELPGRITAFKEAEVRPQITGIVQSRLYTEGSYVKAGQVLFQIDDTSYQSTVNSAKAELKKSLAYLHTAETEMLRYKKLLAQKLSSQQLFDQAESTYLQAKAEVAVQQAALDYANIQLSYTKIKAPIAGQAGFSEVSEGSLLTSSQSNYITTIIQSDQVYVDMKQSALTLYKLQQQFKGAITNKPVVPVRVVLEDGTNYEHEGTLEITDTQVEGSTGTVTLRALIPNPENVLLPGMYVRAHIAYPQARDYIVIPQSIVVRTQSGEPYVYTVNQDNVVERKNITLGDEVGNQWVVEQGLSVGEKVITNNLTKIKNKQSVIIDSNQPTHQTTTKTSTTTHTKTAK